MPISVVDTPREGFLPDWVDPVHESDLIERRRAIHMTPEVGWCEFLSTARAAEVLSGLGFEVKVGREILQPDYVRGRDPEEAQHAELYAKDQGVPRQLLDRMGGLTGCVAVFDTKRPGKTVCIRAELDALYVSEPEDPEHLPARENFHSMRPGVMHACGHDGHQAVLLELGRFIAANKERLTGKIKFIFQPAEEGSRGAYAFVRSGVLDDVDTIICAHFGLDQPPGTVYTAPSKFLCTEKIDFEFIGRPSHAGMHPQTGRNALMAAANAAINLMALPRHGDGMTRVNVGNLHAGEGRNVVAAHATMQIEVRGANEKIKDYLAHGTAAIFSRISPSPIRMTRPSCSAACSNAAARPATSLWAPCRRATASPSTRRKTSTSTSATSRRSTTPTRTSSWRFRESGKRFRSSAGLFSEALFS